MSLIYSHQVILTYGPYNRREPSCAGCSQLLPWGTRCSLYHYPATYVHPTAECEALFRLRHQ